MDPIVLVGQGFLIRLLHYLMVRVREQSQATTRSGYM